MRGQILLVLVSVGKPRCFCKTRYISVYATLGKYTLDKSPDTEVKIPRGFPDCGIKPGPKLCAQVSELPAQMESRVSFSLRREEPLLMN